MIVSFAGAGTEDRFHGRDTKAARRTCPQAVWRVAQRKVDMLNAAPTLESLRVPPSHRPEALSGHRQGQHSIRINEQYRVRSAWTAAGPTGVEVTDYH